MGLLLQIPEQYAFALQRFVWFPFIFEGVSYAKVSSLERANVGKRACNLEVGESLKNEPSLLAASDASCYCDQM